MNPRALITKGGPKDDSWKVCFRCWETGSHLSYECTKAPKVCTRCGLDGGKGPSCGGEYNPVKCMVKGYKPQKRISDNYMDKLRAVAEKMGVKFGATDEKAALIVTPDMVTYKCVDGDGEWVPVPGYILRELTSAVDDSDVGAGANTDEQGAREMLALLLRHRLRSRGRVARMSPQLTL